jgi:hypothetical protein
VGTRSTSIDDLLAQRPRHLPSDLLDRPGRQPEIAGAARFVAQPSALGRHRVAVLLDVGERPGQNDRKLVATKAGSKLASPSCASPISGSAIDWAPSSGASVTPDGVATTMKRASW